MKFFDKGLVFEIAIKTGHLSLEKRASNSVLKYEYSGTIEYRGLTSHYFTHNKTGKVLPVRTAPGWGLVETSVN